MSPRFLRTIRPRPRDSKSRFGRRSARPGIHYRRLVGERLEDRHLLSGAAVAYTVTDLGTLGGISSYAYGINNSGQVVGYADSSGGTHAFLWQAGSGMQDLGGLPGGTWSQANGINNSGQVVGLAYNTDGHTHAFLWQSGSGMQDLGTLPGASDSYAYGINNSGQVVGDAYDSGSGRTHAFLWQSGSGMQDLGTLGGMSSSAYAIDNSGHVVGQASPSQESDHAFLWEIDTGMVDLNSLIPPSSGWTLLTAHAINNGGQIVGEGSSPTGAYHGFLLTPTTFPTADITDVAPDPRTTAVSTIAVVFSHAVFGFDLGDLTLTRVGSANLLTASQTLTTTDNITCTLGNLSGITGTAGAYVLTLTAAGSGITDLAGNPLVGDASDTWLVNPLSFTGTPGDDTFTFTAGGTWHEVLVTLSGGSPTTYRYPASENPTITFDGLGGNDSVTFNGGAGDETAELYPDHGTFTGTGYSVSVSNVESITANSGGGNDQATLHDGPQADTLIGSPAYAILIGPGVWLRANGFRYVTAIAAADGQDVARLYDTSGDDAFTAYPTYAVLTDGTTYSIRANDFGYAMAYATLGGTDTATFFDSPGSDTFTATPTYATMTGKWRPEGASADRSYYNRAEGFDSYEATSTAGADLAKLNDSPASDDQFVAEPTWATLSGSGWSSRANDFRYVSAYATGGNDTAQLKDSAGTDTFVATPDYGVMYAVASANNPAYANRATGFDALDAFSTHGGDDTARLYDSAGDDIFTAAPTYAKIQNDPATNSASYVVNAHTFRYAHAFATAGGFDKATLTDSPGTDTFEARPTNAILSNTTPGQAFYNRANYFEQVFGISSLGGNDMARLYDSAGKDTLQASPTSATLSGTGFSNQAQSFRYVTAYASTGGDEAHLTGSSGDDKFFGSGSTARLYDAAMAAYLLDVRSFQNVDVAGGAGTNTRTIIRPIDYALAFSGTWLGDPWP